MVVYLLAKAGEGGLSRTKTIALMYLTEREAMREHGVPTLLPEFILTPHGPAPKEVLQRIQGGPGQAAKAGKGGAPWLRRLEWVAAERQAADVVADNGAQYGSAAPDGRLALAPDQPISEYAPWREHIGKAEGMPYLGRLAPFDRRMLALVWGQYGAMEEPALTELLLELPEASGRTDGELPLQAILAALGFTPAKIKNCLAFAAELDSIDRMWERIERENGTPEAEATG